jgi:hypothetical protein
LRTTQTLRRSHRRGVCRWRRFDSKTLAHPIACRADVPHDPVGTLTPNAYGSRALSRDRRCSADGSA